MVRKSFAAVALAGLVFFAVPSVANAVTYVPVDPPNNTLASTGGDPGTLASTGTDTPGLLMWPAVGALGLGLGLVSVPLMRRRARA